MECVMKGPSVHTYILLCLFLLITAVGMMHWTLDTKSTSNSAPSSLWQLESATYLSVSYHHIKVLPNETMLIIRLDISRI